MPETFQHFSEFASSFRLSPPKASDGYKEVQLSTVVWHNAEAGEARHFPNLWHRETETMSVDALRKKLSKWLKLRGVESNDQVVGMLIGVLAVLIEDGHDLVSALHKLEASSKQVDAFHHHVLPAIEGDSWNGVFEWKGFRFERLDSQKLVYRCRLAKTPGLEKIAQPLDGAPSMRSPVFQRRIIDVAEIFWQLQTPAIAQHGTAILEPYLQQCSWLHCDAMWEALDDAFLLPFSAGLPLLNLKEIRYFPEAQTWTFYSKLGINHSWVGMQTALRSILVPRFDQAQQFIDQLAQRLKLEDIFGSSLYPLIQAVSRCMLRSTNHLSSQRIDESFLFQVIAIEQVFSEKEETAKAISNRTAVVATKQPINDWPMAYKKVSELYGKRSRLVHSGKSVSIEDLLAISDLSKGVLNCLLRLARRPETRDDKFHKTWLKRLDHLASGLNAEISPSDTDLIENGIIDPPNS